VTGEGRTFAVLVPRYLTWLEVHGFSPMTKKTRGHQLVRFVSWCEERGLVAATEVTPAVLARYQRHLFEHRKKNGQRLGKLAQAHLLSGVVVFFKWCRKARLLLVNPAGELELPKYDRKLPRDVLSPKQVETFLNTIDVTNPLGLRDRAIFELLYSSANRRGEVAGLEVDDLDLDRGTLRVRGGKGGKDRVVPLGQRAAKFIDRYIAEVRTEHAHGTEARALFLAYQGRPMTKSALSNMIAGRLRAAGIAHGGAHLFRHSAATAMLEAGADVRYIQQYLGHAWLSSTEVYTNVSVAKLKQVHTETHPAKLRRKGARRAKAEK
jgi:integrase/recombinase XerD